MGHSLDKGRPMMPAQGMDETEMKSFTQIQSLLALTAYVEEHQLGINAVSYLRRPDKQARMHRREAMDGWDAPRSENEPALAELFREYWQHHRAEIEAADLTSAGVCRALLDKIRGVRNKNPDTT